jgi:hypothetical protein
VSDAATGVPIGDLEPYLGASGHLLVVNQDTTAAIHAHPEDVPGAGKTGPTVTFAPVFPAPGRYKMWAQFQRKGTVVTARSSSRKGKKMKDRRARELQAIGRDELEVEILIRHDPRRPSGSRTRCQGTPRFGLGSTATVCRPAPVVPRTGA